ncbi:MAG: DUF1801 domain-containing protein [Myxococcales bacterium]|nr:DUF1801 domain-containing protein [Myxococcales bacterium]
MVSSKATTPAAYLAGLPADKRAVIAAVRDVVNANLPDGYVEGIQYGMLGWYVPLERYPDTYNGQPIGIAALAAQKSYHALYLMSVYGDPATEAWFKRAFAKAGKKLDMGKSCVRFKQLDDLPLDVIGEAIARLPVEKLIAQHDRVHGGSARKIRAASKPPKKLNKTPAARKKPVQKRR